MTKIGTAKAFISKLRGGMKSRKGDYHTKYGGIWINPMEWDTKIVFRGSHRINKRGTDIHEPIFR